MTLAQVWRGGQGEPACLSRSARAAKPRSANGAGPCCPAGHGHRVLHRVVWVGDWNNRVGDRNEEPTLHQAEIRDEDRWFVARVDFLFRRRRTVVEFDGLQTFGPGSARESVIAEKRRGDRLRSLGCAMVRLTWRNLFAPAKVHLMVRSAFARQGAPWG